MKTVIAQLGFLGIALIIAGSIVLQAFNDDLWLKSAFPTPTPSSNVLGEKLPTTAPSLTPVNTEKKDADASAPVQIVKVTSVTDGDTITVESGQKVRYIGIDTPELHHPQKKVQCFGKEAHEKNRDLVEGKMIRLEKDISETDRFGRLLRYVYLQTADGELFVNEFLVLEGYAYSSTFPPDVKHQNEFNMAQKNAQARGTGLWSSCR